MDYAVRAEGLTKRFGKTEALRGVDIEIERGTVLGVLGPNGAGKTTAVRILTTLIPPDEGRATIDGLDVVRDSQKVRARIGLTGQYAAVDERLTGQENLGHVGRLFHLDKATVRQRSIELLDRFDLSDAADRVVKGYSGGMRRRLDIAMSLIGRPSVLFLDEPTTGLDPRSRAAMWELIDELVREGTTTLLTTQYLDEADRLANRIAVIDHGLVIAEGTSEELKLRSGGERLEVMLTSRDQLDEAVAVLGPFGHGPPLVDDVEPKITIPLERSMGIVPEVVRVLDTAGVKVEDVVVRRPTLDDVFFSLTGHAAEDEGVSDHGD
ncbi:MAG: type transport system ATP-binding protein [Actinomycetota bacterium]|nr:type transport system ATP-binding protein [Actinomycetota bacterium]